MAANRVVNDKIRYVVGPVCSGAAIAAAPIYNNEGVVMVTPSATSPNLTDGKNFHFIFRTIGRDDQQGPSAAKFIIEKIKPKKVAVLHDKQSYGQGIASAVRDDLKKANVVDGQLTIIVRDKAIPLFYLHKWLVRGAKSARQDTGHVVIVQIGTQQVGFVVDNLIGQEEVVIKPLDNLLQGTPGMAGATITSDGGIALILDVPSLLKAYARRH